VRILLTAFLITVVLGAGLVSAQSEPRQSRPRLPQDMPRMSGPAHQVIMDMRRRLLEVDRLLAVGNLSRAEALIEELEDHSQLARDLVPRRIRLAQLKDDHETAATLCREALIQQPRNANLWRELTMATLALDQPDSARAAADSFLVTGPDRRNATVILVDMFGPVVRPLATLALIDSMRVVLEEPRLAARQRALALVVADRQQEAAAEIGDELRANPYNLALIRTALLDGPYEPDRHGDLLRNLDRQAAEPEAVPTEAVLAANLHLAGGDVERALAAVSVLAADQMGRRAMLQNAVTLSRELRLLEDSRQSQATVNFLLPVLEDLAGPGTRDLSIRRRAADMLAMAGTAALDLGLLDDDPRRASVRFTSLLDVVRDVHPGSSELYGARIRLAAFTRDRLGDPGAAARGLEGMLMNPDLPSEGVAVVRLTLGECYLAAGDTARGRVVLTSLGRDRQFRREGGHAHYHLARLDLAEGHFITARDRFAVVAMDNPAAPYANDALELGLAVAEELDNPSGGATLLALYARAVYYDLTAQPEQRREALAAFVLQARAVVDTAEKQHLLERGRWELASLEVDAGRIDQALVFYDAITTEHIDGRYPAAALAERARLLESVGRAAEAREALERLLSQYPDFLFVEDVRDQLRNLP